MPSELIDNATATALAAPSAPAGLPNQVMSYLRLLFNPSSEEVYRYLPVRYAEGRATRAPMFLYEQAHPRQPNTGIANPIPGLYGQFDPNGNLFRGLFAAQPDNPGQAVWNDMLKAVRRIREQRPDVDSRGTIQVSVPPGWLKDPLYALVNGKLDFGGPSDTMQHEQIHYAAEPTLKAHDVTTNLTPTERDYAAEELNGWYGYSMDYLARPYGLAHESLARYAGDDPRYFPITSSVARKLLEGVRQYDPKAAKQIDSMARRRRGSHAK